MKLRTGMAALALGSLLTALAPATAMARDRDDHERNDRQTYDRRAQVQRHEEHGRRDRDDHYDRDRRGSSFYFGYVAPPVYSAPPPVYSAPPQQNGYYDQYGNWHQGYYDQYGNWHETTQSGYYDQYGNWHPYNY